MPATIRKKPTTPICSHRGPVMYASPAVQFKETIVPGKSPLQFLKPIGKPGGLNRDRTSMRRGLQNDLRSRLTHHMPNGRSEVRLPPGRQIIPEGSNRCGKGVAEFLIKHHLTARKVKGEISPARGVADKAA